MPLPHLSRLAVIALSLTIGITLTQLAIAQTGTFIDRQQATDLRVVSSNVYWNSIFPSTTSDEDEKFARVVDALDADIWHLQEIGPNDPTAQDVVDLMNTIAPLPGGATWYGHQSYDNVTVSKYPLTMLATDTIPEPSSTSVAISLVNLPDTQFDTDFYFMNSHFKCCGGTGSSEDLQRQRQADALVNWMRDARTPGGNVNLPVNTPMAVVGDLNIVGSQQPLNTVITGNIINNGTYGADSIPDWDGTSLTDAHPYHNVTGTDSYTYRSSGYTPSRLDYILYTDSVVDVAHKFVLNTIAMSAAERAATGLQSLDVMFTSTSWDHIPVVVDFRFPSDEVPGDYDDSGYVDMDDFEFWKDAYATGNLAADGNQNSRVDAGDFTVWRENLGAGDPPGMGALASVPEPATLLLAIALIGLISPMARTLHRPKFLAPS